MNALLKVLRLLMFIFAGLALAITLVYFARGGAWNFDAFDWPVNDRHRVRGSDHDLTQVRALDDFDAIEIDSRGDFEIKIGDVQSVSLQAPDNVIDLIDTAIRDRTLIVDSKSAFRSAHSPKFTITVPALSKVDVRGSATMHLHGLKGESFTLRSEGACDFSADGTVKNLTIAIEGAGRVDTHKLDAATVKVEVDGAGYARVFARQSLDAEIDGIGSIVYGGSPAQLRRHSGGIGTIEPDSAQIKPDDAQTQPAT